MGEVEFWPFRSISGLSLLFTPYSVNLLNRILMPKIWAILYLRKYLSEFIYFRIKVFSNYPVNVIFWINRASRLGFLNAWFSPYSKSAWKSQNWTNQVDLSQTWLGSIFVKCFFDNRRGSLTNKNDHRL